MEKLRAAVPKVLMDHAILAEAQQNSLNTHIVAGLNGKKNNNDNEQAEATCEAKCKHAHIS